MLSRKLFLNHFQHSKLLCPQWMLAMESLSWIQKILKLSLLKSRLFILLLTFSVLRKTLRSFTML